MPNQMSERAHVNNKKPEKTSVEITAKAHSFGAGAMYSGANLGPKYKVQDVTKIAPIVDLEVARCLRSAGIQSMQGSLWFGLVLN